MYRFATRPRWLALHALLLVVVGLFALAGVWQINRLSERRDRNAFVLERRGMPVADLTDLVDAPNDAVQRRVRASGRYDVGREVILLGRPNEGRPGNHVLTPLVLSGGRAIIVDRGWVPTGTESSSAVDALPPTGRVEVTGIVLPTEGAPLSRQREDEQLQRTISRIHVARIARRLPYDTFPAYLALTTQDRPQPGDLPDPLTLSTLEEGSHLVYAIQWFAFIVIALVGYAAILQREARKQARTTASV